jgi:putative methionine-R-sulfoxide reductase with GAF domain
LPSEWQLLALATLVLAICVLLIVLDLTDREFDVGMSPWRFRFPKRADRSTAQLAAAFERHSDIAQGMAAVIEAEPDDEKVATDWFRLLTEGLAGALSAGSGETFRVGIWVDDDPEEKVMTFFVGHLLDVPPHRELDREKSVAGLVARTGEECYIIDTTTDPRYDPLSRKRKAYRSVFAVPLGEAPDTWGVMTVDAAKVGAFGDLEKEIVRRFGELADIGAYAWASGPPAQQEDG